MIRERKAGPTTNGRPNSIDRAPSSTGATALPKSTKKFPRRKKAREEQLISPRRERCVLRKAEENGDKSPGSLGLGTEIL